MTTETPTLLDLLDDVFPWPRSPVIRTSPTPIINQTQPHVCSCIECGKRKTMTSPVIHVNAILAPSASINTPSGQMSEVRSIVDVPTTSTLDQPSNTVVTDTISEIINQVATDENIKP
ncbi:Hypothetical predicted protein, partial [Olea europaea subsp. europaea]